MSFSPQARRVHVDWAGLKTVALNRSLRVYALKQASSTYYTGLCVDRNLEVFIAPVVGTVDEAELLSNYIFSGTSQWDGIPGAVFLTMDELLTEIRKSQPLYTDTDALFQLDAKAGESGLAGSPTYGSGIIGWLASIWDRCVALYNNAVNALTQLTTTNTRIGDPAGPPAAGTVLDELKQIRNNTQTLGGFNSVPGVVTRGVVTAVPTNTPTTVVSFIVPDGTVVSVGGFSVRGTADGEFQLSIDGDVLLEGRTSAAQPSNVFSFPMNTVPQAIAGQTIAVSVVNPEPANQDYSAALYTAVV